MRWLKLAVAASLLALLAWLLVVVGQHLKADLDELEYGLEERWK